MTSHDTGTPGTPRATALPARTFGPQGPTLGDLSDAYLQDYQVRQFRSQSTARGRIAHLVAFFGRARAGRRADHVSDPPVPTRPARRRGGHRHHQSRNLGPPPHVHPRRPLGLARHRARLPRPPAGESPPPGLLRAPRVPCRSRPTCPPRGRTSSTSPTTPAGARTRSSASPGTRSTRRAASSGSRRPAQRTFGGADPPDLTTHCRCPRATAGTPRPRQPARLPPRRHPRPPLAHGVAHRLSGGWRADPLPPRLPPHRRPQPDPRQRPRAGRHAPDRPQDPRHLRPLQHHQRTRNCSRPGDQLVAYLAQQAQVPRGRAHPTGAAAPRTVSAPPPRATHHRVRGAGRWPDTARLCAAGRAQAHTTGRSAIAAHVATWRADAAEHGHAPDGSASATRGGAAVRLPAGGVSPAPGTGPWAQDR